MKPLTTTLVLCAVFTASSANAALLSRLGSQAVYDTDLNVTWLTNANLAAGSNGGQMTWATAKSWISGMNAANYLGFNDWRLPSTGPVNGISMNYGNSYDGTTDNGFNMSAPGTAYAGSKGSEMAYLFYNELGGKAYVNTAGNYVGANFGIDNPSPFINLQSGLGYWSGTEYMPGTNIPLVFSFSFGSQVYNATSNYQYALVVRTGDVATVPVPSATWLLGSGLVSVAGIARKRKAAE